MLSETVHLDGHIIDSGTLSKVLDLILMHGGDYEITTFKIGTTREAASHAEIVVRAPDVDALHNILQEVGQHGAGAVAHDAEWVPAPRDGVFPDDFYSTTNLESHVRHKGTWLPIEQIEMDCGVVLRDAADGSHAVTVPVHQVRKGDRVLVHEAAVKVVPAPRKDPVSVFGFMSSDVSAERPKELTVAAVAEGMIAAQRKAEDPVRWRPSHHPHRRGPLLEALIAGGWIDVLFAGNALALRHRSGIARDVTRHRLSTGAPDDWHNHLPRHQRHPRRWEHCRGGGKIAHRGVMHACVKHTWTLLAGRARRWGARRDHRQRPCAGRNAPPHSRRRPRDHGGDDATLRGDGQLASRVGADHLRRQHRHDYQAHGPGPTPDVRSW
jgi:hypothetical protein